MFVNEDRMKTRREKLRSRPPKRSPVLSAARGPGRGAAARSPGRFPGRSPAHSPAGARPRPGLKASHTKAVGFHVATPMKIKPIAGIKAATTVRAVAKKRSVSERNPEQMTLRELRVSDDAKARKLASILSEFPDSMIVTDALRMQERRRKTSDSMRQLSPSHSMPSASALDSYASTMGYAGAGKGPVTGTDHSLSAEPPSASVSAVRSPHRVAEDSGTVHGHYHTTSAGGSAAAAPGLMSATSPRRQLPPSPGRKPKQKRARKKWVEPSLEDSKDAIDEISFAGSSGERKPVQKKIQRRKAAKADMFRGAKDRASGKRTKARAVRRRPPPRPPRAGTGLSRVPVPVPFREPSAITQDYIDGYESDESLYAPQFSKMRTVPSLRRVGSDECLSRRSLKSRSKPRIVGLKKSGHLSDAEFYKKYWIEAGKLGEGSFARVRKITRKTDRKPFALKVVKKAGKSKVDLDALRLEIDLLSRISHKNVVNLTDWVYSDKRICIVVEYCSGGDVFERIVKQQKFAESDAVEVVTQVLCGLDHIHSHNIVHRDLKPDNLMYSSRERDAQIKIIDFGLAGDCSKGPMTTPCGTAHYASPEVLCEEPYKAQPDMWSLGVIVYMLLCGFPPFFDASGNTARLYKMIKKAKFRFPSPYWDGVSECAKDFVRALLVKDMNERMTAMQALGHPWIAGKSVTVDRSELYMEQMKYFASSRFFTDAKVQTHAPTATAATSTPEPVAAATGTSLFAREEYAFDFGEHGFIT